jgi:hypothetical protein
MRRRGLTLDQVWLFAGIAFVALRVLLTPIPPYDFWWHMATGRIIATTGSIPVSDSFSFTQAGAPFYNQSWLAQLLIFQLFELGGPPLLILVQALVIAGAYGLLIALCVRRSGQPRLSVGLFLLLTLPASFDNWVVRPQSYAIPLFIAYLFILSEWRLGGSAPANTTEGGEPQTKAEQGTVFTNRPSFRGGRSNAAPLLLLPALGALWVNLHGSFVLGGALIALTFVGELLRRWWEDRAEERAWATRPVGQAEDLLSRPQQPIRPSLWQLVVAGLLTGLSWLANPGGLEVIGYVRELLGSSQVTQLVTEWAPPTIRTPNGTIFFLFVIAAIVILAYARRPPNLTDMLIAGAFFWLALGATRNNIWFTAVATPLLVVQAASWRPEEALRRPVFQGLPAINAALVSVIGLALLLALPWIKPALALPPTLGATIDAATPIDAVAFLQEDPARPARLFHDMGFGSYLIWAAPEQPVWIDPRIELYPFEQWRDYQDLSAGANAEQLLDSYAIDGMLLSNVEQGGLVEWTNEQPAHWELRYTDEVASYFVRR